MVKRDTKWEQKRGVKKAYTVGRSVYYVCQRTDTEDDKFYVQYWPNKNKSVETVSIFDTFDRVEDAVNFLEEKVDEYR
jgi:hypothetical protein